jgi:hypothetical protein
MQEVEAQLAVLMANMAQLAAAKRQLSRRTGTPLRELEHLAAMNGDDSIGEVENSGGAVAADGGVSDTGSGGGDEPTNRNDDEPTNPASTEAANTDDEDAMNTDDDGPDDQEREPGGESAGTDDDLAEVDADADG